MCLAAKQALQFSAHPPGSLAMGRGGTTLQVGCRLLLADVYIQLGVGDPWLWRMAQPSDELQRALIHARAQLALESENFTADCDSDYAQLAVERGSSMPLALERVVSKLQT